MDTTATFVHDPRNRYTDTNTRRMQVVYLRRVMNESYYTISAITRYAVATCKNYATQFRDMVNDAISFFEGVRQKIERVIARDSFKPSPAYAYCVTFTNDECCEEFFKVGMTTRTPSVRMKEKAKQVAKATGTDWREWEWHIDALYYCGNKEQAEMIESLLRAQCKELKKAHQEGNDSFTGIDFWDINLETDMIKFIESQFDITHETF